MIGLCEVKLQSGEQPKKGKTQLALQSNEFARDGIIPYPPSPVPHPPSLIPYPLSPKVVLTFLGTYLPTYSLTHISNL